MGGLRSLVGTGTRQNLLLLVPAAAATMALASPIVQLIYQYGAFNAASTKEVSTALFWFAFSMPFAGLNLLLTRTFFSLQRPWIPSALAAVNLAVNAVVSIALYKPLGIAGPVIGTVVASAGMTAAQMIYLRRQLGGSIEGRETLVMTAKVVFSALLLILVSRGLWLVLDGAVGSGGPAARLIAVVPALAAGLLTYLIAVRLLRIREADQITEFFMSRLRRIRSA